MPKNIKSILFVMCVVMVFTAQTNRPDDKGQKGAAHVKPVPAARPAPQAQIHRQAAPQAQPHRAPQVQVRREAPKPIVERQPVVQVQSHPMQRAYQNMPGPHVYAVPVPAAPAPQQDNRLFNRQHHNHWQPLYNFYNGQYNFYPYVNVNSPVELSADYATIAYNGQTFYYDGGSFYVQDSQGFLAVPPPIGIVVSAIPSNARQLVADGQTYYRKKGVFYVQVDQGYQVVQPIPWPSEDS